MPKTNKARTAIVQAIFKSVPVSVKGMPYARTWVLETVANRLEQENPLLSGDGTKYQETLPFNALLIEKGSCQHYPELEGFAFSFTKNILLADEFDLSTPEKRMLLVNTIREQI